MSLLSGCWVCKTVHDAMLRAIFIKGARTWPKPPSFPCVRTKCDNALNSTICFDFFAALPFREISCENLTFLHPAFIRSR